MKFKYKNEKTKQEETYQFQKFFADWSTLERKGYLIWFGQVKQLAPPYETYFLKFSLKGSMDKGWFEKAKIRYQSEGKFKVKHLNITFIKQFGENGKLILEEGDEEFLNESNLDLKEFEDKLCFPKIHSALIGEKKKGFGNCYQYFESCKDEGLIFLLEEYVDGKDVTEYYSQGNSQINYQNEECVKILFSHIRQALVGMCAYMNQHRKDRLILRDISPNNLMILNKKDILKYIDYEMAHNNGSRKTINGIDFPGGTVGYTDPRRFARERIHDDIQMDIYSLGMVFLYMICGCTYLESMAPNDYRENPQNPKFYTLEEERLIRDGTKVFQGEKYRLLRNIIKKMIAIDTERYEMPNQILEDFDQFLNQSYGKNVWEDIFVKEEILEGIDYPKEIYILSVYREKVTEQYTLETNRVIEIYDEKQRVPILMIAITKEQIYTVPLTKEWEETEGTGFELNEKNSFLLNGERVTVKLRRRRKL